MKILKLNAPSLASNLEAVIELHDEFLESIRVETNRTTVEKRAILEHMQAAPMTTVLLVQSESGEAIGISYYNFGTGYSCGGAYLWLNGIYLRPDYRGCGHGKALLRYIEEDGLEQGITLFMTCRNLQNEASEGLFASADFTQESQSVMWKTFAPEDCPPDS